MKSLILVEQPVQSHVTIPHLESAVAGVSKVVSVKTIWSEILTESAFHLQTVPNKIKVKKFIFILSPLGLASTHEIIYFLAEACPEGEHFTLCGSACPATCEKPNPRICITLCIKGCFCDPGLIRNAEGKCVPPAECPECKYPIKFSW